MDLTKKGDQKVNFITFLHATFIIKQLLENALFISSITKIFGHYHIPGLFTWYGIIDHLFSYFTLLTCYKFQSSLRSGRTSSEVDRLPHLSPQHTSNNLDFHSIIGGPLDTRIRVINVGFLPPRAI